MAEQLSNVGYLALKKEVTKGTPLVPNVFVPFYDDSMVTDLQMDEDTPIMGNKMEVYQTFPGMRAHKGSVSLMAEPNTAAYLLDMLFTKSGTTGSNPYTHTFSPSITTNPNSYTVDIQKGQVVDRYFGLEASELSIDFDKNKMMFKMNFSALGSFKVREIASLATNTVTLNTNYDPTPTTGLVATDLVRVIRPSTGATIIDTTVTSITATTVVLAAGTGIVAGDLLYIRAQTPTFSVKTPFLWSRTEFRFAADAATALSATQTRMDDGTNYTLNHNFEDDNGAERSGAFDPATLVRTTADGKLDAKLYFDKPDDLNRFLTNTKRACVIRHFSETGFEFRVTLNNLRATEDKMDTKTKEVIYQEMTYRATWDPTDSQGIKIDVINAIATI
jgi:hypothetical protein